MQKELNTANNQPIKQSTVCKALKLQLYIDKILTATKQVYHGYGTCPAVVFITVLLSNKQYS